MGRARGEHALAAAGTAWWQHLRTPAGVAVEPENHPDAFPAGEILDGMFEVAGSKQFDHARLVLRCGGLARRFDLGDMCGPHVADRRNYEFCCVRFHVDPNRYAVRVLST